MTTPARRGKEIYSWPGDAFRPVPLSDIALTLAKASVFEMRELDGRHSRNEMVFEDCREFGATSELSFNVGAEASAESFYVRGTRFLIEKGFQMTWRVVE